MADWKISFTHTLDGVEVVPGLKVWDYDLRRRIAAAPVSHTESNGDQWWIMIDPETGRRGSIMNPSRMWVRHPSTGERA